MPCSAYALYSHTPPSPTITDKDRSNLLQSILPYGLDSYAIRGKPTFIKVRYGCILFMDIVSYCKIIGENTDVIVFLILKQIYDIIDSVIEKYKYIQKVETIGDAYMVVGDMDNRNNSNPEMYVNMIEFAFEVMDKIKQLRIPDRTVRLRIGIHTGSFVVSFYGKIRPRLCVIGKHINIASRIQSTAEPTSIQISNEMYQTLQRHNVVDKYSYIENRNVVLKNIGDVTAYTVLRGISGDGL
jgi:adenylate cyclase